MDYLAQNALRSIECYPAIVASRPGSPILVSTAGDADEAR